MRNTKRSLSKKMNTLIVTASRYGSTQQIGGWIKERLEYEGFSVTHQSAKDMPNPDNYELVIMGSGIYSHYVLPELKAFIEQNLDRGHS